METYLNYIKTGFPETPLASNAQQPRKPYRLIYPVSEYTGNSSNVLILVLRIALLKSDNSVLLR